MEKVTPDIYSSELLKEGFACVDMAEKPYGILICNVV
jgi:hypothetical protein